MAVKRRERVVRVLLTDPEWREIKRAADRAGAPTAVFVRIAGLEKARAEAGAKERA